MKIKEVKKLISDLKFTKQHFQCNMKDCRSDAYWEVGKKVDRYNNLIYRLESSIDNCEVDFEIDEYNDLIIFNSEY